MRRKILLTLTLIFICSIAQAQCVGEIVGIEQLTDLGQIRVVTQYKCNGIVVDTDATPCSTCIGGSRYSANSGTNEEIIIKAKEDVANQAEALIKRMPANREFLKNNKILLNAEAEGINTDGKTVEAVYVEYRELMQDRRAAQIAELNTANDAIIKAIKGSLVGHKETKSEVVEKYLNKDIKVTYDAKNSVTNTLSVIE